MFTRLQAAGYPVNEVNKLGILRAAIKKGSTKYNITLELCEFTSKSYQEAMDKLHEQDVKYEMIQYAEGPSRKENNRKILTKTCTTVLK